MGTSLIVKNFLQIVKPIKRYLNSSNFIFLHKLLFSSGFFGETTKKKRLKMVKIGLIMMMAPVLTSVLSMKMPLTVCQTNS